MLLTLFVIIPATLPVRSAHPGRFSLFIAPPMQTTLTKEYAGRGKAVFIEGGTFKTIIPLPEGKVIVVNDTINDTVNDIVKKRLGRIILLSYNNQGLRISELANKLKVSEVTIKRDMQKIRTLVAYRGSQKTGGYFLTDYMLSKLDM